MRLPDFDGFLAVLEEILLESAGTPLQLRDPGLLHSAFARPENRLAYGEPADAFDLAAALAFGIARNHPLVDGNKRAAAAGFMVTLLLNGKRLDATQGDVVESFMALADGEMDEGDLANWGRDHALDDTRFVERSGT